jgi:Phage integrase family
MVRQETGGALRPDGSLTVQEFWEQIHFPTLKLRIAPNTEAMYRSWWKNFVCPAIGRAELQHVNKAAVDAILNGLAASKKAEGSIKRVLSLMHGIRAASTKNGKTRIVPLPPALHGELDQWAAGQPGDLIFPNGRGGMDRRARDAMRDIVRNVRLASGIADLTPRMCRTTFATLFDADPRDLQDILGHSSVNLTMEVYRRPITSRQLAAMEEYEARLRRKLVTMTPKEKAG